jgi:WhiB family redox-sensing transcriptional regulator
MNTHPSRLPLYDLRGACLEGAECLFDPELHDGPDHGEVIERPLDRAAREDIAKEICGMCPVRDACLEYALRTKPDGGIWAGLDTDEVAVLASTRAAQEQPTVSHVTYRGVA